MAMLTTDYHRENAEGLESLVAKLKASHAQKILIQFPEGLKMRILDMAQSIEQAGIRTLLSCETTYGACDLRDKEAKALGCDLLLHIGHADFGVKPVLPVIYEPYRMPIDPLPLLEKHLTPLKKYHTLCLITTVQFTDIIEPATQFLKKNGIEVQIEKQNRSGIAGQVLGCDYSAAKPSEKKVDAFLYIGSGLFHPLGLALVTDKPVLFLDIETGELKDLEKEKIRQENIRQACIAKARDAHRFGILLTTKEGQGFVMLAEQLRNKLKQQGKEAWILVMDEITPEKIMGMGLEVLVNCACPRMNEDTALFRKPILNPKDVAEI